MIYIHPNINHMHFIYICVLEGLRVENHKFVLYELEEDLGIVNTYLERSLVSDASPWTG
jgi:hypothetical protein